jgi:hypothetical protein
VITAVGDEGTEEELDENPDSLFVTDSDRGWGSDRVQTYRYDDYWAPVPPNTEPGWYFNYLDVFHPYIMNVTTLGRTAQNGGDVVKVHGSYRILQRESTSATDLHYVACTDTDILGYDTQIDWSADSVSIAGPGNPPYEITADWYIASNPVHLGTKVTITTEFVLPAWNAIEYYDVYFTYPEEGDSLSEFKWSIDTPPVGYTEVPGICGGYVVGAFEIYRDEACTDTVGWYRLQHEYDYTQNPEQHTFVLESVESSDTYYIKGLRFGHSYGLVDNDELWAWEGDDWIDAFSVSRTLGPGDTIQIDIDWTGLLPYPCLAIGTGTRSLPAPSHAVELRQNYPNPFSGASGTNIPFSVGTAGNVEIRIYDVAGRLVRSIERYATPGENSVFWNGRASDGSGLASGVYFYQLRAGSDTISQRKMLRLK